MGRGKKKQNRPGTTYRFLNHLCCSTWYGALLNNNSARLRVPSNIGCYGLEGRHVGRRSLARAFCLGRGVDRDQYHICLRDAFAHISAEEQVWLPFCYFYVLAGTAADPRAGNTRQDFHIDIGVGPWLVLQYRLLCSISSNADDIF